MTESGFDISPARPEDARGIQEVFYRAWMHAYPNKEAGITKEDIEDRYKYRLSPSAMTRVFYTIRNPEPGSVYLVARHGKRVVGVVRAAKEKKGNAILALYVLPSYHHRGIGRALVDEALLALNPKRDTYAEIVRYNTDAIAFYKALGFKETGREWMSKDFVFPSGMQFPMLEMVLTARPASN